MTSVEAAEDWARGLDELAERIAPRFRRIEARHRARSYLSGLLAPLERKNGWHLAEAAGDASPDSVQDFLSRMRWDADAVRDDLRAYVVEHLGDVDAVMALETGFIKKGEHSVGVQRQYSGTAGRIENCQVGVFLGYASRHGHALLDRALYLPKTWAGDEERRRIAWVPEDVSFATKPKLGIKMLERALDAGVPCAWVTGDCIYGSDSTLRRFLERRRVGYVLAVTSAQHLWPGAGARLGRGCSGRWLAPAQRRCRSQGPAAVRLGFPALPRRRAGGLGKGAADPAQPGRETGAGVLSHLGPARNDAGRSRAGGGHALDD